MTTSRDFFHWLALAAAGWLLLGGFGGLGLFAARRRRAA